jgi:hypothetical protein
VLACCDSEGGVRRVQSIGGAGAGEDREPAVGVPASAGEADIDPNAVYALGSSSSSSESARLQRQADELAPDSTALLDRVDLRPGDSAIDLGCGPRGHRVAVGPGLAGRAGVYPAGHSRRTIRADLVRAMRPQVVDMGLADERELEELDGAARKHFEDPDTVVMPSLMFLAWGRKPAAA